MGLCVQPSSRPSGELQGLVGLSDEYVGFRAMCQGQGMEALRQACRTFRP